MLAHYSNLPTEATLGEPLYENLFEVTFTFPDLLGLSDGDAELMMINTTNMDLNLTRKLGVVEQYFKYSGRLFLSTAKGNSTIQDMNLNFNINVDDNYSIRTWNYMKKWYDLAWNSQNGVLHYKREMIGEIVAHIHDRKGVVVRRVEFKNVQLNELGGHSFSFDNEGIIQGSANFVSDHWIDLYYDI